MVIICNCKHCIRTSGSGTEIIIGKRVADIDVDGVSLRDLAVNLHDLNILDGVIHIPKKKKKKERILHWLPYRSSWQSQSQWHGPSASHPRPGHRFPAESQIKIKSWPSTPVTVPVSMAAASWLHERA